MLLYAIATGLSACVLLRKNREKYEEEEKQAHTQLLIYVYVTEYSEKKEEKMWGERDGKKEDIK